MKKIALIPIAATLGFIGYATFHPGVAYAEPRMTSGKVTPFAQQGSYTVDPQHTSVYFDIAHLGLSQVHGRFGKFSGKIMEDGSDLTKSSVSFNIQVGSVDTAVEARDNHLRTADFFEAEKFPLMTFKSTKIEKTDDGYTATGDLTIKGKTKSISIPFKHYGPIKVTQGPEVTRIGVICEPITIKRSDFGVGADSKMPDGTVAISDDVTLRLSLEATLDKAG